MITMALALLMTAGVLHMGVASEAADLVCGDGDKEGTEQCDDGNLKNGDGCSSSCTVELCGNNAIDLNEQCDDGNKNDNDGCNRYCQIEFCGDQVIQPARGEQCDDGNGISGDGCSGICKLESQPAPTPVTPDQPQVIVPPPAPPSQQNQPQIPASMVASANQSQQFLASVDGADYKEYLTNSEIIQLEQIINKLASGRRLTATEREWAEALYLKLEQAKAAERLRYTDLLRQFIATPISSDVVDEKELNKSRLVDVYVPIAIDELQKAVAVIRRGELKSQVTYDLAKLKRQGIDLTSEAPENFQKNLEPGVQPIKVFATLKTMKEAAERYATTNLPVSLDIIREEATALKQALPIFEREYGLTKEETEPLLTAIENVSKEVTKKDTERIVAAVNRFLGILERENIFTQADVAALDLETKHAAAAAERIAQQAGLTDATQADTLAYIDALAGAAPANTRQAYSVGSIEEQRTILLSLLLTDERVSSMRETLRKDGNTDLDARYEVLTESIRRVGTGDITGIGCDDSMNDAIRCTNEYLNDLQDAVRNRSFFSRLIGNLQDFFEIGT